MKTKNNNWILAGGLILSCIIMSILACKKNKPQEEPPQDKMKSITVNITNIYPDTLVSGKATFTQKNDEAVNLQLELTVPSRANKSVAVHLHAMADCGNNGNMAMGHWNPTNVNHGQWGTAPFHLGDIGNINLDNAGKATFNLSTNLWNIDGADASRNVRGRSIIIHSGVDKYNVQPTGAAGNRIGCGCIN